MIKINGQVELTRINIYTKTSEDTFKCYGTTDCRETMLNYVRGAVGDPAIEEDIVILLKNPVIEDEEKVKAFLKRFNSLFNTNFYATLIDVRTGGGYSYTQKFAIYMKNDFGFRAFKRYEEFSVLALLAENKRIVNAFIKAPPYGFGLELKKMIMDIGDHDKYMWTAFYVSARLGGNLPNVSGVNGPSNAMHYLYSPDDLVKFVRGLEDKYKQRIIDTFRNEDENGSSKARYSLLALEA